jgi:putative membrane protein
VVQNSRTSSVGHLEQGFVPALIARELSPLKRGPWLTFLVICVSLAISALYELVEWWVAIFSGEDADAFLGTQGYVWDTQSDMACALLGPILALIFLSKLHDRQLTKYERDD